MRMGRWGNERPFFLGGGGEGFRAGWEEEGGLAVVQLARLVVRHGLTVVTKV